MSGASQLELQDDISTAKAEIQQAKQDLCAAEAKGDENTVAYQRKQLEQLRKQLEQLREEKLILLRAQPAGQLCSLLSPTVFLCISAYLWLEGLL